MLRWGQLVVVGSGVLVDQMSQDLLHYSGDPETSPKIN